MMLYLMPYVRTPGLDEQLASATFPKYDQSIRRQDSFQQMTNPMM